MDVSRICVVGGSGFLGHSVVRALAARGIGVRVLTRNRPRAMRLAVLPTVEIMVTNPHETASLARAFEGMDAVVNLVGILSEGGKRTFQAVHVELPARIADACHSAGVLQLIHVSALGASASGPSAYQRSKAEGEARLQANAGPMALTILRPSVVFGEDDRFLNLFATLARLFPVIPLARAHTRFQPIWVEDVARCVALSAGDPRHMGKTYDLCGPHARTLEELVRFTCDTIGKRRAIVALPDALGAIQASVLGVLPGKLMTRDNFDSMAVDNICTQPFPATFGFAPASLEAVVPRYLRA